ncbi:DUF3533 domain-containing protein [Streptomyces erythrochromogenes]|uniref:YhgE/Pip domain-containing protein n=1 Tax=Streptomyces erythrochromogenes TaxID=285574 RepID=UPI0034445EED
MSSRYRDHGRTSFTPLLTPSLWGMPTAMVAVLALLLPLIYMGGILDPRGQMRDLPVGLVTEDRAVPGSPEPFGDAVAASVRAADPDRHIDWKSLDMAEARQQLASDRLFGVLVIPADFTARVRALTGPGPAQARPRIDVLTNPAAGSLGSSLAGAAMQQAAHAASAKLGTTLSASASGAASPAGDGAAAAAPASAAADGAAASPVRLLLADPVEVTVSVGHPIGARTGMGLSAFYYALLLVLLGFLAAGIVSGGTDIALGYAPSEVGPLRSYRPPVTISRRTAFLLNSALTASLSFVTSSLLMAVTVGFLDMDAAHLPQLWVFSVAATAAVGVGAQALTSALGALAQPVGMLFFIALALPSSGGTIPVQAVPHAYRFLAEFEPMRQVMDGVRAILFFDARADAGLLRAWTMTGAALVGAVVAGLAVTSFYDRRGLQRVPRDLPAAS